ncbi:amidohydrolase [Salirhabdus euzebyi]|uniref:Amidohydrolase n=1 Tax=Salirhabdus euzebyi TaxID=394506 RepID=A0A841Q8G1_9BACI|nr:M20 peptidase aminoacylase family protein [Salirhabdus euzebyi]MBB6454613.1 amidohydrolase [Salirhabdus euzebyi]
MGINLLDLTPKLDEIFNFLHENPEISWEEVKTTEYIKSVVKKYPCKITTFDDCTGLVVDIGQGKPVVALRTDIDALWQEVNGEFRANHSCGHDAHMTIVLGTFFALVEQQEKLDGTVRFIFQPAEEQGTGALKMVEKGVVDDVDFLYGIHLRPIQELTHNQFAPAIQHGAARFVNGVIKGEDAHGARPHLNVNAIAVGAELVQLINNMSFDPVVPHSMKVTSFHAGGKSTNIIPGNATFSVDMRAQTNELMDTMMSQLKKMARALSDYHDIDIKLEISSNVAAAVINEEARALLEEAICATVGESKLKPMIMTSGGDDFHFYTIKRPELKASMLAVGCDLKPGLHHPNMTFNHDVIPDVVRVLVSAILKTLRD